MARRPIPKKKRRTTSERYKTFWETRARLLKEKNKLMVERSRINRQIRQVQSELDGWDKPLIHGE